MQHSNIQSDINDTAFKTKYLSELSTYSLSRIHREPSIIQHQLYEFDKLYQQSIVSNYTIYPSSHELLQSIYNRLHHINELCTDIVSHNDVQHHSIHSLSDELNKYQLQLSKLDKLQQYTTIINDILELPALCQQLIYNELYDECNDIFNYAHTLYTRYTNNKIMNELNHTMQSMKQLLLNQLCLQLTQQCTLAQCMRLSTYIKRLYTQNNYKSTNSHHSITDQLKLLFLKYRTVYMQSLINGISNNTPYGMINQLIDIYRINLYEIVVQYNAIFTDTNNPIDCNQPDTTLTIWSHQHITQLMTRLSTALPLITDSTLLLNLLEQSMYCGLSWSRIGCDIRLLLNDMYNSTLSSLFINDINNAITQFKSSLESYEWYIHTVELQKIGMPLHISTITIESNKQYIIQHIDNIIEYPSLSILLNNLITSFNRIRHCLPVSIKPIIVQYIQLCCYSTAKLLLELDTTIDDVYSNDIKKRFSAKQSITLSKSEQLQQLSYTYDTILIPYIEYMIQSLFHDMTVQLDTQTIHNVLQPLYANINNKPDGIVTNNNITPDITTDIKPVTNGIDTEVKLNIHVNNQSSGHIADNRSDINTHTNIAHDNNAANGVIGHNSSTGTMHDDNVCVESL